MLEKSRADSITEVGCGACPLFSSGVVAWDLRPSTAGEPIGSVCASLDVHTESWRGDGDDGGGVARECGDSGLQSGSSVSSPEEALSVEESALSSKKRIVS